MVLPEKETIMTDELVGYTKTKIQIQEVYKGNCKKGEILFISEPYYEGYYDGKRCIVIHEKYEPLIVKQTYKFSLVQDEVLQGTYRIVENGEDSVLYHKVS